MTAIDDLAKAGTSTWLDDLSRDRLNSGNLAELIETKSIVGVTTNPAIFATAMSRGSAYDEQIEKLKNEGAAADEAVYAMAIEDVRRACDVFQEVYRSSGGKDGRVSIEVDPRISEDTEKTIAQARELWKRVDRPNAMIKIPATAGSLPAVTEALAEGISVNVTLIFSVECYRKVWAAFSEGIRRAKANGLDITTIHSVASLFVSRVDTEVDKRLEAIGTEEALGLKGTAGIANARRAYAAFKQLIVSDQVPAGANIQRPLWASTGVKDPAYPADMYVVELAGPNTVNTMPEPTIDAALDGDNIAGDTLTPNLREAEEVFRKLTDIGIDFDDVFAVLEREGVEKFVDSWNGLLDSMTGQLAG